MQEFGLRYRKSECVVEGKITIVKLGRLVT